MGVDSMIRSSIVINTKWVFKGKQHDDGTAKWYKAQLVTNGMQQVEGTDNRDLQPGDQTQLHSSCANGGSF